MPHYILTIAPADESHGHKHIAGTVEAISQKQAIALSAHRLPAGHVADVRLWSTAGKWWQKTADDYDDAPRLRRQAAQTDAARVTSVLRAAEGVGGTKLPALSAEAREAYAAAVAALRVANDLAEREAAAIVVETEATEKARVRP